MRFASRIILAVAFVLAAVASPVWAGVSDPLYVNLTTSEDHRSNMAIVFSKNQLDRGHPVTIFLNDKGVLLGSKTQAAAYSAQQKLLTEMIGKGAVVLICPMCMKHYGVKEADVLPGIKVGNPELTGDALFKDNTKTLTW